jgi:uncharacterized protein YlxW (UPF0749 family)
MDNKELINKFSTLKARHTELVSEKIKYEAKRDQLNSEIKEIQNKYSEYDLSSIESVEKIINDLTTQLNSEIESIDAQYAKLKAM